MMTSRAEYRLLLRQDNADLRLTKVGYQAGLVSKANYRKLLEKEKGIEAGEHLLDTVLPPVAELNAFLSEHNEPEVKTGITIRALLKRNNLNLHDFNAKFHFFDDFSPEIVDQLNIIAKYEGYINIQKQQVEQQHQNESIIIPPEIDYSNLRGLRLEARQKLQRIQPKDLAQASRISGVSPADISVLTIYIKQLKNNKK